MTLAARLLDRLEGVRETGPGRWLARCPAHEDRSPSLSVRELDDKVLVYDFAGCGVHDILAAVGLEASALFPPPGSVSYEGRRRPQARRIPAADILAALGADLSFIAICAADMGHGDTLDVCDMARLNQASARFRAAVHAGGFR